MTAPDDGPEPATDLRAPPQTLLPASGRRHRRRWWRTGRPADRRPGGPRRARARRRNLHRRWGHRRGTPAAVPAPLTGRRRRPLHQRISASPRVPNIDATVFGTVTWWWQRQGRSGPAAPRRPRLEEHPPARPRASQPHRPRSNRRRPDSSHTPTTPTATKPTRRRPARELAPTAPTPAAITNRRSPGRGHIDPPCSRRRRGDEGFRST